MTQIIVSDMSTGEVLTDKTIYGAKSKGGWVMFYQEKGFDLIAKAPTPAVLKVFMYLSMGQTYEGGMKTTKAAVQEKLGLSKPTTLAAFKWLKDNFIVHEWRVDGVAEFMVNPVYVCIGKFDDRMKLWNLRWGEYQPIYSRSDYARKKARQLQQQKAATS